MITITLSSDEFEILNATVDDAENLERIYKSVQRAEPPLSLAETVETVRGLVEKGLLSPRGETNGLPNRGLDRSHVWKAWFQMTPLGREVWAVSARSPNPSREPVSASRFGAWHDISVDLPLDAFQEARRELWGTSDGERRE